MHSTGWVYSQPDYDHRLDATINQPGKNKNMNTEIEVSADGLLNFQSICKKTYAESIGKRGQVHLYIDGYGNFVIDVNGHIQNWGRDAEAAIQNFKDNNPND